MSNKTTLQENNTLLDGYISRIIAAKNEVSELPDSNDGSSDSGGASVETVSVTIKTKKMPTTSFLVESIYYVSAVEGVLSVTNHSSVVYMNTIENVAVGTILFIKTINSPSKCTVDTSSMELISFNAAVGAVIKITGTPSAQIAFS